MRCNNCGKENSTGHRVWFHEDQGSAGVAAQGGAVPQGCGTAGPDHILRSQDLHDATHL